MFTTTVSALPNLDIHLLGASYFSFGQSPLNLSRRQPIAILAYLLLAEGAVSRDRLAFLLWPDEAQPVARNRLRMTLFQLRESLTPANAADLIVTAGDAVSLDLVRVHCDVREFLKLTEQCLQNQAHQDYSHSALTRAEEANRLYRGEFMEGFALQSAVQQSAVQQSAVQQSSVQASGVEFENWMLQQRQRLERIHRRLLTVLVEGHAAHSGWSEAIRYGEQLAAIDPLDESNHRSLLQLYSACGQRHALVEHFERMRGLLKEELGVEPLPETVELYQSLVARSGARPPNRSLKQNEAPKQAWRLRTTISLPMIGRDAELAQISAWLNEAMAGKLSVICVQGVAGSGKTRLLHEATAHFHYPVWLGSGQQVAQTTPYLAILRALRSGLAAFDPALLTQALRALPDLWLAEASRLLPELRDLRPDLRLPPTLPLEQAQARLFEALTRLAVVLAQAQGGAFLVVDDLHDADSESFDWLLNLAHHLQNQRTPLAIAVAFDSNIEHAALKNGPALQNGSALKNWIGNLQHDGIYRPLPLAPLSSQALTTLVQTVQSDKAGSLPTLQIPSLVQKLTEYSEGTPFIVLELLRTWLDQGVSAHDPLVNPEASVSLSIPESVHSLLRSRIAQLDPIAAQLFDVFALAQTALEMEEAQQIAGRDEFATAEAIDQLLAMQLVQADGLYYSVSHTILGEMALTAIGKTRRRLLHRRAGEVLQQRVDGAALAAFHFEAAAMTEAAAQNYFSAAQHAWALFAAEPALQSLTRALALSPVSEPLLFAIYALHEEVLHHLGRRNEQKSVLGALLELASKLSHSEQITAAFRNGRYLFARNRWQAAEERLLAAQRLQIENEEPLSLQVTLLLGRAQAQQQRYEDAIGTIQNALSEAHRRRNRPGQIDSLIVLAEIEQARENLAASENYLQQARTLGPRYDTATQARLDYSLGRLAFVRGHYAEALNLGRRAEALQQTIANREGVASALLLLAATLARQHEFAAALANYAQAQLIFQQIGNRQGEAATLVNAGALALRSGDLQRAQTLNQQAIALFAAIGDDRGVAIGSLNLALTLVWQSEKDEAESWARRGLEICKQRSFAVQQAAALGILAAALTQQGRLDEAAELYHDAVTRRRALGHADACCDAASLALVYLRQGNLSAAEEWSAVAVADFETEKGAGAELGYRVYIGRAQVLHARGEDDTAYALLRLAQGKLEETLARFTNDEARQQFLAAVPFHRVLNDALKEKIWANPPALV